MLWHRTKCARIYVLRSSFITRKPEVIFQFAEYTIISRRPNHNYYKIYLLCVYLSICLHRLINNYGYIRKYGVQEQEDKIIEKDVKANDPDML